MSCTYLKFPLDRANTVRTPEAYGLAYFNRRGDSICCDVLRQFSTILANKNHILGIVLPTIFILK